MNQALLIEIALKSLLISGFALLLLKLLSSRSAAERSWVAHAGLVATLLLPVFSLAGPEWRVEAPAPVVRALTSPQVEAAPAPALEAVPPVVNRQVAAPASAARQPALSREQVPLVFYGIPAGLLMLMTLIAIGRLYLLRRRATVLVEQAWLSALALAQRRMGFKHGTALLVSSELGSPVSWGVLRPIIVLNEDAVRSGGDAEAIIAHELAHVARLDWAKLLVGRIATALFWFNPFVWILASQCHQLREEAADDAVLASDVPCTDYAQLLVFAAKHESKGLLLAANGVAPGRGSLQRRVARILDERLPRAPARAAWAAACAAGALIVCAPLAALTPIAATDFAAVAAPVQAATRPVARVAAIEPRKVATVDAEPEMLPQKLPVLPLVAAEAAPAKLQPVLHRPAEAAAPETAVAHSEISAGSFNAISLTGGGRIIIRYGAVHRARVLRGGQAAVSVAGGSLSVSCHHGCDGEPVVEVVTPSVRAISIHGGGQIEAQGAFPAQANIALSVNGGGTIDLRAITGTRVAASTRGGGHIRTSAREQLAASTNGGGEILYWGDPQVATSMLGGGGRVDRGPGR